jgi:hypothetical protein
MSSVSFPVDTSLINRVFAVRTPWNVYAKVRVDQQLPTGELVFRWVTYEAPNQPSVEIVGEWYREASETNLPETTPEREAALNRWGAWEGANHYWADLVLEYNNLYLATPLEIDWQYDGPERFIVQPFDRRRAHLDIDLVSEGAEVSKFGWPVTNFNAILVVEARDIFGRTASARREFQGTSLHWIPNTIQLLDPERLWFLLRPEILSLQSFAEVINAFQSMSNRIR